jgi:flagellar FliJ protein
LRNLRIRWSQEENKKNQLEEYLHDYRVRLNQSSITGISVTVMMDFRRFISKIELAIATQIDEIAKCKIQWEAAQKTWQECEREVKAYRALRTRHEQAELVKENRREQKLLDEFALNGHRRKTSEGTLPNS